jgi:hypothetical protein
VSLFNYQLTETQIRKLKPTLKTVKLADGKGLYLYVEPRGSKLWRYAYRFAGKQKLLSLGVYPDVSLLASIILGFHCWLVCFCAQAALSIRLTQTPAQFVNRKEQEK